MLTQSSYAQVLARIYTAANCTDCNDCLNAAAQVWEAVDGSISGLLEAPKFAIRFRALGNRYAQLKKKEVAAGTFWMVEKYIKVEQFERQFNALAEIEGRPLPLPTPAAPKAPAHGLTTLQAAQCLAPAGAVITAISAPAHLTPEGLIKLATGATHVSISPAAPADLPGREDRIAKAAALTSANITDKAERAADALALVVENKLNPTRNNSILETAARYERKLRTALRNFKAMNPNALTYRAGLNELARLVLRGSAKVLDCGYGYILGKEAANRLTLAVEYSEAAYRSQVKPEPMPEVVTLSQEDDEIWKRGSERNPGAFIFDGYRMEPKDGGWSPARFTEPADFLTLPVSVPYSIKSPAEGR